MKRVLSICILLAFCSIAQAQNWYADSSMSWSNYQLLTEPSKYKATLYSANYFSGYFNPKIASLESKYELFSSLALKKDYPYTKDYDGLAVSDVRFLSGFSEGQSLKVIHQQKLNNHTLLGNFYSNRSAGLMRNQALKHTHLGIKVKGPISKRLSYKAKALVGTYEQQVNGGLSNDSVLFNEINQYELLSVNLLNAKETYRNREAMLNIKYGFEGNYSTDSIPQFLNWKHHVYFKTRYQNQSRVFSDQALNAQFYPAIILDSNSTNDCTLVANFSQAVGLSLTNGFGGNLSFEVNHTYRQFFAISSAGAQSDLRLEGRVSSPEGSEAKYALKANYSVYGYFAGDYNVEVENEKPLVSAISYFARLKLRKESPLPFYHAYLSNHQFWNLSLDDEKLQELELGLKGYGISAQLFYRNTGNTIYFTQESIHQLDEDLQVYGLSATGNVRLGERVQLRQEISLQSGSNSVFNLPSTISRSSASVQFKVFKADIPIRLGIDYLYIDGLENGFFSPSLGRLVYAPGNELKSLQQLDAILGMQVKTVRVYVKARNLLNLLLEERQLYLPGYMLSPTNVQLALSWRVFD